MHERLEVLFQDVTDLKEAYLILDREHKAVVKENLAPLRSVELEGRVESPRGPPS